MNTQQTLFFVCSVFLDGGVIKYLRMVHAYGTFLELSEASENVYDVLIVIRTS